MLRLTQMQAQRNTQAEQLQTLQTNLYQLQSALASIEPLYREILAEPLEPELMDDAPVVAPKPVARVLPFAKSKQVLQGNS